MEEAGDIRQLSDESEKPRLKGQALKDAWLEALRSGRYAKGSSKLKTTTLGLGQTHFCCLGVLCDVVSPNGWDKDRPDIFCDSDNTSMVTYPSVSFCGTTGLNLNEYNVLENTGVRPDSVNINRSLFYELAAVNDREKSFEKVIGLIEKYVKPTEEGEDATKV